MNYETQAKRVIKELKKRKVKNFEFAKMHILSHTKVISTIRQMGFTVNKERVYSKDGKATNTYQYWIPRKRKDEGIDGMFYEKLPKSKFFSNVKRWFR